MALAYRKGTHDLQGERGTAERGRVGRTAYGVGRTREPQRLRKTGRILSSHCSRVTAA